MAGGRREGADAYQRALGLLVRREHSRRDLARKLAQRGVEPAEAAAAVEKLAGQGYQDDQRFADSFARDRTSAGYGPVRIRVELAGHGLAEDAIEAALAACEADWPALARRQVERRWRPAELADPARRRKAVEFLLRRGFDQDSVWSAVRAAPGDDDA
jgi:regulatory protein